MTGLTREQVETYLRDGYLSPLRVFSDAETRALRERLEAAEALAAPGRERSAR